MPQSRIIDVLAEVFRTHGFDTTAPAHPEDPMGNTHRVDLLAEKDGLDVIVTALTDPSRTPDMVETHARTREAVGARYALAAATHAIDEDTRDQAETMQVLLWDSDQVSRAIGRAVLMEVTGAEDPPIADLLALAPLGSLPAHGPTPATPTDSEPLVSVTTVAAKPEQTPQAPTIESMEPANALPFSDLIHPVSPTEEPTPLTQNTEAPVRNIETGRGWYMETSSPKTPERTVEPTVSATLNAPGARTGIPQSNGRDPHTFTPPSGALLAPGVDKEAAARIAQGEIFTIENTRLRYHPKRLFRWQVEAFVEGQVKTHTIQGTCLVDVATKQLEVPEQWDAPRHLREGTFDVPVDHKPVRMEPEQARDLVITHVLEETAREATMQDDDSAGDYALTVKRRVRVQKEDIKIEDQGLHWCPVWWLNGKNGEMEVDGLNAFIRSKQLQNIPSETILL